jgi:hypothetical protein
LQEADYKLSLIIDIFRTMASGRSIDEQKDELSAMPMQPVATASAALPGHGEPEHDPYMDDESDYGSDDD